MIQTCPLCSRNGADVENHQGQGIPLTKPMNRIECPTCGVFLFPAKNPKNELPKYDKNHILSGITRRATEEGKLRTIYPDDREQLDRLIESTPIPHDPLEAMDLLLEYIARKTEYPGYFVPINFDNDYPIIFAKNTKEFVFYLNNMIDRYGLIVNSGHSTFQITTKGWERLREIRKTSINSDQAFVAMWFDNQMDDAWKNGIEPALTATNFKPIRADKSQYNDKICDWILGQIKKSGLLIADFTEHRGGVYFEAGYALGLGIPVIWTCRKDHMDNTHFDTRQYNHILWETPDDLKKQLIDRIEATLPIRSKPKNG